MRKITISPLVLLLFPILAFAQTDDARQAIDRGDYVGVVNLLSDAVAERPDADALLYLGIAYRHIREFGKAEDTLREGAKRYPEDARFHNELANLYLDNKDSDAAKLEFERALAVNPADRYASDELASIHMSEGEIQAALQAWNRTGRPLINDVLHNDYPNFGSWVVRHGVDFHPATPLKYSQWKTTETRLFETDNFVNVDLEIEPAPAPDEYNAVVRTTRKTNTLTDFAFNLLKGAPIETSYLDLWNIANSGVNFSGNYRWDAERRRIEGGFKMPLPFAGLLNLEVGDTWRAERWDLSNTIRAESRPQARLDYKANALQVRLKAIPSYRVEVAAGFEYRNRAAKGSLPELFTDSRNTGKFTLEAALRLVDRRYQNRLRLEAFAARRWIIGDAQFAGGVAELDNRIAISSDTRTYFNWTLKGGSARGLLPVEDYFVLGLDVHPENVLRGHTAASHGRYGNGPMGTDFALINTSVERRLATIPFFNNLNIPYLSVSWEAFCDAAKTWDRNHVFDSSKLLVDAGGGIRLGTPTHALHLTYGRSLRDGQNVFFAYYERRFW